MEKIFKLEIGGRELIADIKNLAEQSNGSVFLRYGDTLVLTTAVMSDHIREGIDFFPLSVEYEEKFYAAGKIKGPRYIKRETRPSDEAVCNARLIDRSIRPLFPKGLKKETQIVVTVLSWDNQNEPDILGLLASSLALGISDIPWKGPLGGVRIGKIEDKFILNPTYEEREKSNIDIVFTAVKKDDVLINMIEGSSDEAQERVIIEAYKFAKPHLEKLIDFQNKIIKEIGKEKIVLPLSQKDKDLENQVKNLVKDELEKAVYDQDKKRKKNTLSRLKEEILDFCRENHPEKIGYALGFFEELIADLIHKNILEKDRRPDDRALDKIRELSFEVGLLPRTHGSGLFCRGQTKSLSILTLGAPGDVQLLEGMEIVGKKRFMHHYNFPPYCVGETKPIRGPGRREIGHGMLAEKALLPVIPSFDEFPYTTRIVSEMLSSNGSTSMASISSSSLALMDAGVPIKSAVAGIAIGLVSDDKGNYKLLTDIQGPEDHHGNMDFKVAGTKNGITAIQMDVKIEGISEKIFKESLERGKRARIEILSQMNKIMQKPRSELSPFAPRILVLRINPEKIRKVIGPGGKIINEIIEECGVSIDIEETGEVYITAEKEEAAKKALSWIENITRDIKVGEIFQGRVVRILDFGAFVEIVPGQDGLLHISRLAPYRVRKVEDVVKIGDIIPVKVISIDDQGRIDLSLNNKEGYGGKRPRKRE